MWLMNGICKVIAQLLNDLLDLIVLFASGKFPNHPLEPVLRGQHKYQAPGGNYLLKSADLSLVIELVI
jgi:hypothetical protein